MPFSRVPSPFGPPEPFERGTRVQLVLVDGEIVTGEFDGLFLPPAAPHDPHGGWRIVVVGPWWRRFVPTSNVVGLSGPDGLLVRDAWDPAGRCSSPLQRSLSPSC